MADLSEESWVFDGPSNNHIVWRDAENRVCFMTHSNGTDPEADTARATLVASAPILLQNLQWIKRVCEEEIPLEYTEGMRRILLRNIRDAANAAIAKATQP